MKPFEQKAFFMEHAVTDAKNAKDMLKLRYEQLAGSSRCGKEAKQMKVAINAIDRFIGKYDKPAAPEEIVVVLP